MSEPACLDRRRLLSLGAWGMVSVSLCALTACGGGGDSTPADTDGTGGVYVGSTAGTFHYTGDAGDSWATLPVVFPRIGSVVVLDA